MIGCTRYLFRIAQGGIRLTASAESQCPSGQRSTPRQGAGGRLERYMIPCNTVIEEGADLP